MKRIMVLLAILFLSSASYSRENTDSLAYMFIPDPASFFNGAEAAAKMLRPGKVKGGELSMSMGIMLGDPGFHNVRKDRPVMCLVMKPSAKGGKPGLAYFLEAAKDNAVRFIENLKQMKFICKQSGKLIVFARSDGEVSEAMKSVSLYKSLSRTKKADHLYLSVNIKGFMNFYRPVIEMYLQRIALQMQIKPMGTKYGGDAVNDKNSERLIKMAKVYIYGLYEVMNQCDSMEVGLSFSGESVLASTEFFASAGSPFARFLSGVSPGNLKVNNHLPENGIYSMIYSCNTESLISFFDSLVLSAEKRDPALSGISKSLYYQSFANLRNWWNGDIAYTMGATETGKITFSYVQSIKNRDDALKYIKEYGRISAQYMSMLSQNGKGAARLSLAENSRTYRDISVSRYDIDMDFSSMSAEEQKSVEKLLGKKFSYEFVVTDRFFASSTEPEKLNRMVDSIADGKGGTDFVSMKEFGENYDTYMDYDIAAIFSRLIPALGKVGDENSARIREALSKIKRADSTILFVQKSESGSAKGKLKVPLKFFSEVMPIMSEIEQGKPMNGGKMKQGGFN